MTLYNTAYHDVIEMPVSKLNTLLMWRIKYEEEKQKKINEEMDKQKTKAKSYKKK